MRRFLSLFMVLMLSGILAFSQSRVVTGRVTDDQGNPVPFATVKVKGSRTGVSADANGTFTIKASNNDVLVVSATGMSNSEIAVGSQTNVSASLTRSAATLTEVVVSGGYGTRRSQRTAVSNAQVVNNQQLTVIRPTDVNTALAGKVAGIQVQGQSTAALGRATNIRLHGEGGFGSGSLLYIVDGTPLTNASDINPDDIEDATILAGPTGAAIYGPQAANGAVIVTLKKGKRSQKGLGIEVNSGVQFDKAYILPNYQNSYAGGGVYDMQQFTWKPGMPDEWKSLDGKFYHDYTDDASWGPRMVGQEYIPWYAWYPGTKYTGKTAKLNPQPNNARDFFRTGTLVNNNVSLSKGGDAYNARISYTNIDQKGIIPNSFLKKNMLTSSFSVDLASQLTVGANINYVTQDQNAENDDAYSNNSSGSFNQWFHRDLDMGILKELRGYTTPITSTGGGILPSWNHANPDSYDASNPDKFYRGNFWYDYFSYFDNIENKFKRNRLYGDVNLTYKVTPDLKLRGAYRKNEVNTSTEDRYKSILEKSAGQSQLKAYYGTQETYFKDDRFELTGNYTKKIKDVSFDLLAGGEIVKITSKAISGNTNNGLIIPDFFSLSNSKDQPSQSNPRSEERRRAVFGRLQVGYKGFLNAEMTLRNDWFSTLQPIDLVTLKPNQSTKNSIFVKSFGLNFIFSDVLKNVSWLSYGKIRGVWGETPQAISPYENQLSYSVLQDKWNGNAIMPVPNTIPSPTLTGSVQTVKEIGIDLKFLKNRVGVSATYFDAVTKNNPISVQINGASGYTAETVNAGKIVRNYADFTVNLKPVWSKNFHWEMNTNMSKEIRNRVDSIAPGITKINLGTGGSGANFSGITTPRVVHIAHQGWGMLVGGGKTYINGKPVIDAQGHYVKSEDVQFGSVLPDFTGGVQNSFTYKGFTLNVNIDFQKGGKFFSLSDMWGSYSGLLQRTAVLNDKGLPIRDAVADGGGVHVTGVAEDGKTPVDRYIDAQDYFHSMVNNNVYDEFIYDLTFVKLRELSLGYELPLRKLHINKYVQSATFSIVSRNLWLIYAKTKDFDPSEIQSVYGENGQYPGTRSIGFNLKIGF